MDLAVDSWLIGLAFLLPWVVFGFLLAKYFWGDLMNAQSGTETIAGEQFLSQLELQALLHLMNDRETLNHCTLIVEEFDEDGERFAGWVKVLDVRGMLWLTGVLDLARAQAELELELAG